MRNFRRVWLVATILAICGCSNTVEPVSAETDELMDLVYQDLEKHRAAQLNADADRDQATTQPNSVMSVSHRENPGDVRPNASSAAEAVSTGFSFQIGDRFPIVKMTQQIVGPAEANVDPSNNVTSAVTWQYLLSVVDIEPTVIVFRLKFERVASEYLIGNQRIRFDSAQNTTTTDPAFAEVQALVGLELDFTLTANQQGPTVISENEFLQSVASRLPTDQQHIANAIAAKVRRGGIAELLDQAIGLVPATQTEIAAGTTWVRENDSVQGRFTTTARVESIEGDQQTIATESRYSSQQLSAQVSILSGSCRGQGKFDSATGLPLQFTRQSTVDLQIVQPSGQSMLRRKQMTETIQTFANQRGPVASRQSAMVNSPIRQVSGQSTNSNAVRPANQVRPETENLSSSAVAHYPE